jgi:hypothetical protein
MVCRIAGVADVFDAVTADRVYRAAMPVGEAVELLLEGPNASAARTSSPATAARSAPSSSRAAP